MGPLLQNPISDQEKANLIGRYAFKSKSERHLATELADLTLIN
jgi:hypothetical protein